MGSCCALEYSGVTGIEEFEIRPQVHPPGVEQKQRGRDAPHPGAAQPSAEPQEQRDIHREEGEGQHARHRGQLQPQRGEGRQHQGIERRGGDLQCLAGVEHQAPPLGQVLRHGVGDEAVVEAVAGHEVVIQRVHHDGGQHQEAVEHRVAFEPVPHPASHPAQGGRTGRRAVGR